VGEKKEIVRATGVVSISTFASRILGLIRDMVISSYFGTTMATDAFFIAFTIPNLFRRLFGEGCLTVSFVPVYTEYMTRHPREAPQVIHVVTTALGIVLLLITGIGIVLTPWIVKLQVFGWSEPALLKLTVLLTRICFPYLFFIGLVALAMGILNSHRHFAAPALAPCLLNICIIASVFILAPHMEPPIMTLAIGVFLGGLAQLFLQLPFLRSRGITFKIDLSWKHPALRRIAAMMLPMMLGIAAFQFNQVVNRFLASFLPKGSISYLYFADRIFEFPLGLFAIALGVAVLPSFSRLVAEGQMDEFTEELNFALRLVLFITIPAMAGLIILRVPILNLLFQHGAFTYRSTLLSAQALLCYALSIWAYGGIHVLSRAFFAMGDTRTPVKVALMALVANFVTGVILMHPLQHAGLALANALSAILNASTLAYVFHKKTEGLRFEQLGVSLLKIVAGVIPMSVAVYVMAHTHQWTESGGYLLKIPLIAGTVGVGMILFFGSSYLLKNEELRFLLTAITRGRVRR
jgi:putative peptidoglycan lipid II flippase